MKPSGRKKVFSFVVYSFIIYLIGSVFLLTFNIKVRGFEKVNLVSDILKNPETKVIEIPKKQLSKVADLHSKDFELYQKPVLITNFYKDSLSLPKFAKKIEQLQNGDKVKIRIAYFGDSMIEGDLLTQTLRRLLQEKFGGSGVGYLPLSSPVAGFRQTANAFSQNFISQNFMTKGAKNMYLSGYMFSGSGTGNYTDKTIKNPANSLEKYILFQNNQSITFNGNKVDLQSDGIFSRKVLSNDFSNKINIETNSSDTKIFGVGFESESGIILDNFSFRGITGIELKKLDAEFLKEISDKNPYDLIVFQYGVNMLFRPNDTEYSYYKTSFTPVLKNFKTAFPSSDFLIVSSADRAFKYNGEYKSAIGIHNLIDLQAKLAFDNKMAFYNQFQSMGGENSIVKWVQQTPKLAGKDYIHPNGKGADILAEKIFKAMLNDYSKLAKNHTPKND